MRRMRWGRAEARAKTSCMNLEGGTGREEEEEEALWWLRGEEEEEE